LHDARVVVVRLYVSLLCPLVTISVIARLLLACARGAFPHGHQCQYLDGGRRHGVVVSGVCCMPVLVVLFHMGINASIWTVVGGMA